MLKINNYFIALIALASTLAAMELPDRGQALRKPVNPEEFYTLESIMAPLTDEEIAQKEENINTAFRIRRYQEKHHPRYPKPAVTIIQRPTREQRQSVIIPADEGGDSCAKVSPLARDVLQNETKKANAALQANSAVRK